MTLPGDTELPQEALIRLFGRHGCVRVDTPVLQPAEIFLDLSGEDIRRRLYLTQDGEGGEFCLRPEWTIPVCRQHLAAGQPAGEYSYLGPVFRQRRGEAGEFIQAGFESLGRPDTGPADADALGLALEGLGLFPDRAFEVRVGDMGLTGALLDALELSGGARRRLGRALAARHGLDRLLDSDSRPPRSDHAGLLAAIEGQAPMAARAFVEDVISIAGIVRVGGRSATEIAERFLSRAENRSGAISERARDVLRRYFRIKGDVDEAASAIRVLASDAGLELSGAVDALEERTGFMAALGLDVGKLRFAADFARNLDYYTGFIFEVRQPSSGPGRYAAAGGRYDGLLQHLGASGPVPAIGCSFWLDRLTGPPA